MKILYVGMKYDYGIKERGLSFEHYNFYDSLAHTGADITYFDFISEMQERGKRAMNAALVQAVKDEAPDLMFTVLFKDEIEGRTLSYVTEETETTTMNWFCDDHWRFDDFSKNYAPCFDYAVTTAKSAVPKYEAMGYKNCIKSQWACNHFLYRRLDLPLAHDLTFVGQPHSDRRQVIEAIRAAGVRADAWGNGWEGGRVSQDDMIRIFNQSRINLNLSNSSTPVAKPASPARDYAWRASQVVRRLPGGEALVSGVKRIRAGTGGEANSTAATAPPAARTYSEQIKGRNFEVPGCGGFVLSSAVDELDKYYREGREVVCYDGTADLIEKARYYLRNDEERRAVADAGYTRTLREHTYAHRFAEIFQRAGLRCEPLDALLKASTTQLDA